MIQIWSSGIAVGSSNSLNSVPGRILMVINIWIGGKQFNDPSAVSEKSSKQILTPPHFPSVVTVNVNRVFIIV